MELLGQIYNTLLYKPLFNGLILLYQYIPGRDFGVAIIALTALIRLASYPLMAKSVKSQKILSELQPKIRQIQQEFKQDRQRQAKEIMALYQKEKINPLGSFLPLLIQLPVLFALYGVFWKGLNPGEINNLYSFMTKPESISPFFFGIINLSSPNVFLAILAGVTQFFQAKMMIASKPKNLSSAEAMAGKQSQGGKTPSFSSMFEKQTLYFFPVFIAIIFLRLPSALGLYIVTTNLFSIVQQYFILAAISRAKNLPKKFTP